jgi:hypothetical protein
VAARTYRRSNATSTAIISLVSFHGRHAHRRGVSTMVKETDRRDQRSRGEQRRSRLLARISGIGH